MSICTETSRTVRKQPRCHPTEIPVELELDLQWLFGPGAGRNARSTAGPMIDQAPRPASPSNNEFGDSPDRNTL